MAMAPALARAQDRAVHLNVGGGPTFLNGDLGNHFSSGWGPGVGITFDANKHFSLQFEYAYRYFLADNAVVLGASQFSANHTTHQLDFNVVANLTKPDSSTRVYVTAGPGAYYRSVEITKYVGTGVICDPYWYVCGTYPVTGVLGSRGGWDPGFNVGGGVAFKIGHSEEFYIESRYHYTWGPDIKPTAPITGTPLNGGSSSGAYLPLTFGFRF
jgi:opacity protein-like surface antigen